ncbi:MAG: BrnT family toxin [bacterium]
MNIKSLIWLSDVIDKIESKHGVTVEEVEEIFKARTLYRRGPRGKKRKGEDVYKAYGQTEAGRYLFVAFIYKLDHRALILSARDMDETERDLYRKG